MARFPHPTEFGTLGTEDADLLSAAKTWQWGSGRPVTRTTSSFAQTGPPRFQTDTSSQTAPRFDNNRWAQTAPQNWTNARGVQTSSRFDNSVGTQVDISSPFSYKQFLLDQAVKEEQKINSPMSPYERYMMNTAPMPRLRIPNMGQAISSGLNIGENEHMYGRVADFQGHQNDLDRAQAAAMQKNSFDQQAAMQKSNQDFQQSQSARQFGYDSALQQNQFQNQQQMQQNEFGQQRQMQASSQAFQQNMAGINYGYQTELQHQSILGNLANTATGGIFGALTEGVHELGEYVNQKSNQNFQERMNPVLFNQNKQLQQAQITGNLENTGIQTLGNVAVSALSNVASVWMNHANNEFAQAQQTRNFNNAIYANGQSAQALKIAN